MAYWTCTQCTFADNKGPACHMCYAQRCGACSFVNCEGSSTCHICDTRLKPSFGQPVRIWTCACDSDAAYCGAHNKLLIFQELPTRSSATYPMSTDDMRYIGSVMDQSAIFSMINGPIVAKITNCTQTQHACGESITYDIPYRVQSITINKSRNGIEITGPTADVMGKMLAQSAESRRPVCLEVITADATDGRKNEGGSHTTHATILAILPSGQLYLIDPNSNTSIADYRAQDVESAILSIMPAPGTKYDDDPTSYDLLPSYELVPQAKWLGNRPYNINGQFADLGVSSGWCRTISIVIAGLLMRVNRPMKPEAILPYVAGLPRELLIIMYDAVIRHVVSHLLTPADCTKLLAQRDEQARKHQASLRPPVVEARPVAPAIVGPA